jgi:hypothetical protein
VPVVALEGPADGLAGLVEAGDVAAGDRVFTWG